MKKGFLILLCFSSINLFSQIEKPIKKGNKLIGGNASFSYLSEKYYKVGYFDLSPNLGYFVIDHLAIGIVPTIGFNYTKNKSQNSSATFTHSQTNVALGPFAKYYFDEGLIFSLITGYSRFDYKDSNKLNQITNLYSITPGIGYAYFLNQKTSLEAMLVYLHRIDETNNAWGHIDNLSLDFGLQIFF